MGSPDVRSCGVPYVRDVQTYVVERYLTGWSGDEVTGLLARLDALGPRFTEQGVHYLHSIVLTSDETCLSVFRALDPERLRVANTEAGLPTDRIVGATLGGPDDPVIG